jgi:hypothetical protein
MKRKSLLYVFMFILIGWVFVPAAHATPIDPLPDAGYVGTTANNQAKDGKTSKEVYTINSQDLYLAGFQCIGIGCSDDPTNMFYYGKSAVSNITNVVADIYTNPPADLALWVRDTAQAMGFMPKQANAQGIGFSGLSVLLPIWKGFRNIAYALLAIVMIVIGFMVMFRKKIDPKTVVTVQNALPKIVITLLLITFSYAIVGLMIDLMYLVIALAAALLIPVSNGALGADTASKYMNGGIWNLFVMVLGGGLNSVNSIASLLSVHDIPIIGSGIPVVGGVANILIGAIVAVALLIAWVRILFLLVGAYIQILISLFIGPLQILTEAFPGSNGFSSWLKNLFVNIAVFPITAAMLMIGTILASLNQGATKVWTPPLLSSGGATGWVGIIGLGVLFAIPGIAGSLKEALKAKPAVNAGPGAIFGPIGTGVSQGMNLWYQGTMIKSMGKHGGPNPPPNNDLASAIQAQKKGIQLPGEE